MVSTLPMELQLLIWATECLAQAGQQPEGTPTNSGSKYSFILKTKEVHLLATFILAYIGVEVTLGGMCILGPALIVVLLNLIRMDRNLYH